MDHTRTTDVNRYLWHGWKQEHQPTVHLKKSTFPFVGLRNKKHKKLITLVSKIYCGFLQLRSHHFWFFVHFLTLALHYNLHVMSCHVLSDPFEFSGGWRIALFFNILFCITHLLFILNFFFFFFCDSWERGGCDKIGWINPRTRENLLTDTFRSLVLKRVILEVQSRCSNNLSEWFHLY